MLKRAPTVLELGSDTRGSHIALFAGAPDAELLRLHASKAFPYSLSDFLNAFRCGATLGGRMYSPLQLMRASQRRLSYFDETNHDL